MRFLLEIVYNSLGHFEFAHTWSCGNIQEDYGPLTAYDGQMKIDVDFVVVVPHRPLDPLAFSSELIHQRCYIRFHLRINAVKPS